jgi:hypothetical protein
MISTSRLVAGAERKSNAGNPSRMIIVEGSRTLLRRSGRMCRVVIRLDVFLLVVEVVMVVFASVVAILHQVDHDCQLRQLHLPHPRNNQITMSPNCELQYRTLPRLHDVRSRVLHGYHILCRGCIILLHLPACNATTPNEQSKIV